ncbi:ATP synthase subunit A [Bacillus cereus group sp. MYBK59-1]|uniref:ATP synthase subunit A n=1 Tax=Bacillus cereus group sp. MYBK59-1 TaxID=3450617 RepID=UPI002A414046|nr:ATP synthase subunit A [Bacillus cereus]MDA2135427.1 ATP synthase subunit A [Bacillus cereus]
MNIKKVMLASAFGFTVLAGTNFPGLESQKVSAAVDNSTTDQGRVIEVTSEDILIEVIGPNNKTQTVKIIPAFGANFKVSDFKVGDYVKATGQGWSGFMFSIEATSVQKINVSTSAIQNVAPSSDLDTIQGRIIDLEDNTIYIESKKYNSSLDNIVPITLPSTNNTFKIGDYIKATGSLWRDMRTSMAATSVEKIDEINALTSGVHLNNLGVPNYIVGEITNKSEYTSEQGHYVTVTYPTPSGKLDTVRVNFSLPNSFQIGDKVKVKNMPEWIRSNIAETFENDIEKIQETKTSTPKDDQWIWSE